MTPDEWLPILAKRLDARYVGSTVEGEYPGVAKLRRYAHGHADLPEMGTNLKASWLAFQRKSRTDYGGAAVRSLGNRIRPNGLRIGETDEHPALIAARRQWRDNRLDVQVKDAVQDYLETGFGYLVVGTDGQAVITRERPEEFIAAPDPLRPWKARAALKVWRDRDIERDFARVWVTGAAQVYFRPMRNSFGTERTGATGTDWVRLTEEPELYDGDPPVGILDRGDAGAFLEPHMDTIDRINLGKLQRLVTTAMQAFRQRALKRDPKSPELPREDAEGNEIDYARVFEPAPGALWELPEGFDVWESQQTDIRPMLEGEKADARDFSAETGTPIWVLLPGGENQSAAAADGSKEPQVFQATDDIARIKPALAVVLVYALRVEGVDLAGDTIEILFTPPEHVSTSEKYAAAAQAKVAGMTWDSIARTILGWSPEQIAQDSAARAGDALMAGLAFPVSDPTVPDVKQPAA